MRAVLDTNVLVAAALSSHGPPARLVRAWIDGVFDIVVSDKLLTELGRALAYPKVRRRLPPTDADEFVELFRRYAIVVPDPPEPPPVRASDPDDDYLINLARAAGSLLVSGDKHLLALRDQLPILSPAEFLEQLDA